MRRCGPWMFSPAVAAFEIEQLRLPHLTVLQPTNQTVAFGQWQGCCTMKRMSEWPSKKTRRVESVFIFNCCCRHVPNVIRWMCQCQCLVSWHTQTTQTQTLKVKSEWGMSHLNAFVKNDTDAGTADTGYLRYRIFDIWIKKQHWLWLNSVAMFVKCCCYTPLLFCTVLVRPLLLLVLWLNSEQKKLTLWWTVWHYHNSTGYCVPSGAL